MNKQPITPEQILADGQDTAEFHGRTVRKGTIKAAIENAKIILSNEASIDEKANAENMFKSLVPSMIALELDRYLVWKDAKIQKLMESCLIDES